MRNSYLPEWATHTYKLMIYCLSAPAGGAVGVAVAGVVAPAAAAAVVAAAAAAFTFEGADTPVAPTTVGVRRKLGARPGIGGKAPTRPCALPSWPADAVAVIGAPPWAPASTVLTTPPWAVTAAVGAAVGAADAGETTVMTGVSVVGVAVVMGAEVVIGAEVVVYAMPAGGTPASETFVASVPAVAMG